MGHGVGTGRAGGETETLTALKGSQETEQTDSGP